VSHQKRDFGGAVCEPEGYIGYLAVLAGNVASPSLDTAKTAAAQATNTAATISAGK